MTGPTAARWPARWLAALLALALAAVMVRAPAFSADYRPIGRGWLELARNSVDPKAYALTRARAALLAGDPSAEKWARRALSRAPENAFAWLVLAWALAAKGDDAAARAALARSYRFAPRSTALAPSRVALAQRWWPEMGPAERRALIEETRHARGLDAHAFNRMAEAIPRLAAIHRLGARREARR